MKLKKSIDFTQGPILKSLIIFVVPLILESLLQQLYGTADTAVVGKIVGDDALSAVGSTTHLSSLMLYLFIGLSSGATVVCAKHFGAKNHEKVQNTVHTAILLGICSGIILAIVGFFFSKTFLRWMDTPEDILDSAASYLTVIFLGSPFSMTYNFGAGLLRASGDTRRPLYILLFSGAINVVLNIVLVLLFPQIGVICVALATVISKIFSCVAVLYILSHSDSSLKLDLRKLAIHKDELINILKIGIPAGLNSVLYSSANIIMQVRLNTFGKTYLAAGTAATNLLNYPALVLSAMNTGIISFTGQNMGAKQFDRINKAVKYGLLICGIGLTVFTVVYITFGKTLLTIFTDSDEVLAIAYLKLFVMSFAEFCDAPSNVYAGALRGMEKATVSTCLNFFFVWGSRVIWLLVFFPMWNTFMSLLAVFPISWGLASIAQTFAFYFTRKNVYAKAAKE